MKIAFITCSYPSPAQPSNGTFVQQFVWAMARQGNECSVIHPTSVFAVRHGRLPPLFLREEAGGGATVGVVRPPCLTFSSKNVRISHTGRWTQRSFNIAVRMALRATGPAPEIIYGHFLYVSGYAAMLMGKAVRCPVVIGVGESSPWTVEAFGAGRARQHFSTRGHFLSNSTPNKEMLIDLLGIQPERILVEPNGVDPGRMYPRDGVEIRKELGIETGDFVVAFVGANNERKGPDRVVRAVETLEGVKCILMGSGTDRVQAACVLRSGPVSHDVVPELLACADLFVLPTTTEGSCNAVIEAMACGLPVVTSKGRYMDDIVDDSVAVRVDPMDVGEIREAIVTLKNDLERRRRMSEACLQKAKRFDIDARARRVTEWMKGLVAGLREGELSGGSS